MSEIFGRLGGPRDESDTPEEDDAELAGLPLAARWLRRNVAGGAAALTTQVDGSYRASTVTGYMVASLDPFLVFISLEQDSQMEHWIRESGVFALSVLSYRQQFLADRFAGMAPLAPTRFQGIEHAVGETGAPFLTAAIGWADCRVVSELSMGDHTCFVGQVLASGRGNGFGDDPLVYFRGKYVRLR